MKVFVVTSQAPYGPQERFVVREAEALSRLGCETTLVPLRPRRKGGAAETRLPSVVLGLFAPAELAAAARLVARRPVVAARLMRLLLTDRRPGVLAKNLTIVPLACRLAELVQRSGVMHIHAAWASTPATAALLVSQLTGTPWSFSAHRWDIDEANLAPAKLRSARFARVISARGRAQLATAAGHVEGCEKIVCLHLGVPLDGPPARPPDLRGRPLFVMSVGNLVEKKGHRFLVHAASLLRDRGVPLEVRIVGEGPERPVLENLVAEAGLDGTVRLEGQLPGHRVDELLRDSADVLVQPSVVTSSGEYEGIPVSLMEGMAAGRPVIATRTGSIEELVTPGTGLLVPGGDPGALADAIEVLARDPDLAVRLGASGRARVAEAFDESRTVAELARLMTQPAGLACECFDGASHG